MKKNNLMLIGLLVALVAIYLIVDLTGGKSKSKSMKSELVTLNLEEVTKLEVEGKEGLVSVSKNGENWEVTIPSGKTVPATKSAVDNALNALEGIKPSRMASKKPEKWKDYQVDSTGTRVKVYEGSELSLDIVLGKFQMEGQQSFSSFVRLFEDNEVYNVKNFMAFSVPSNANSYRDKTMVKIAKDSIAQITFSYPADSSFVLTNSVGNWSVNGQPADSAATVRYVRALSGVNGGAFYDEDFMAVNPDASVNISMMDGKEVTIDAFLKDEEWIMHSSLNETSWFQDEKAFGKIFTSKDVLISD